MEIMRSTGQLAGNQTLQQITLPGTHDSGAYNLTHELAPDASGSEILDALIKIAEKLGVPIWEVITPWAKAQDRDFYEQFKAGIRYVDLRACWNGTEWRTFHFEMGLPIQVMLNDARKFLSESHGEILVLEISHFNGKPTPVDLARLVQQIESTLGPWLYPRTREFRDTYDEMIRQNFRAVVSVESDDAIRSHPLIWPGSAMRNSYANSDNTTIMIPYNERKVLEYNIGKFPKQLFKISWTLTPNAVTILSSLDPGRPRSLIELADKANVLLDDFGKQQKAKKLQLGNLFLVDHFETSDVINVVKVAMMSTALGREPHVLVEP